MITENIEIKERLENTFGGGVFNFKLEKDEILTFEIDPQINTSVILYLKNSEDLQFNFLTDMCGIHYPDNDDEHQFAVVYLMHNWITNTRIRIKTYLNATPEIKTISNIFLSSNWMEREAWDFYGINFIGHPQLKRILNMDEMISHPMRKEFPMEDAGRTDKDDRFFGRTSINS